MILSTFFQLLSVLGALIASVSAFYFVIINKLKNREIEEVKTNVDQTVQQFIAISEKNDDVFTLMIKNVAELREYYTINKQQARRAFTAALTMAILGFIVFIVGLLISFINKLPATVNLSAVVSLTIEIVSGLFFWLYKSALTQINIFHKSLLKTEKFLTAIQLVEKIDANKRDDCYRFIIEGIVSNDIAELKGQIAEPVNK